MSEPHSRTLSTGVTVRRTVGLLGRFGLLILLLAFMAITSRGWAPRAVLGQAIQGPGVAVGFDLGSINELDALGDVWYLDYRFDNPNIGNHARLYVASLTTPPAQASAAAQYSRGQWWTFGNEPNDPNQDNIAPQAYVIPYHDMYYAIKRADPQARIIPTGVANADWRWLKEWRDEYRKVYGRYPPVDGWNVHDYVLDSCGDALNVVEFKRRIIEFRDWMQQIGDGARPLFLSEYGVLYGNGCCGCPSIPSTAVVDYMRATTRWLELSHMVNAWAWFAVDTANRFNGDLFAQGQILPTGIAYQQLVRDWQARAR